MIEQCSMSIPTNPLILILKIINFICRTLKKLVQLNRMKTKKPLQIIPISIKDDEKLEFEFLSAETTAEKIK